MNERNSKIGIILIFLFAMMLLLLPKYINKVIKTDHSTNQRKEIIITYGVLQKYKGQASVIIKPIGITKIGNNVTDIGFSEYDNFNKLFKIDKAHIKINHNIK